MSQPRNPIMTVDTNKSSDLYYATQAKTNENEKPTLNSLQLKYKTNEETKLPSKETTLRRAANLGNVKDIEFLIRDYQADVLAKSSNGFSALDWAYMNNQMEAVNTLCWLYADQSLLKPLLWKYVTETESEWPEKNIALCRAAAKGKKDDIKVLVERYKADAFTYAIKEAQKNNHVHIVNLLTGYRSQMEEKNKSNPTSLLRK